MAKKSAAQKKPGEKIQLQEEDLKKIQGGKNGVQMSDVTVTKLVDKSNPKLFLK